jgi:peptide/nickel transport system substrate-binding protein
MTGHVRSALATALLVGLFVSGPALAQKPGGILKTSHFDSPASMSMLEEATGAANRPMMGVFNNLVMYKQDVAQTSLQSIIPDLAAAWSWNEDGTEITFPLRQGVRWHDGKPFTAKDVVCTWNLLTDKSADKLRLNPRKSWYRNLEQVTANGDYEVTFRLKRPQPSFLALLASGWSPVYPCHVPAREMRSRPIGTGPFKFVAFKPNESIVVARNALYWKQDRPYLDGIEYTIIPDVATRMLAFIAGKFDMASPYGVTIPLLKDVRSRVPQAVCEITSTNISRDLIINRAAPPFDNPDLRRAMALSLDRQAFIDILSAGQGDIGGAMLPPPEGIWGMPPEMLRTLPGYDPDVRNNRAEARRIMNGLGYRTDHRLPIKLSTRNMAAVRDPAVLLIDQLKEIYIDGDLDAVDTVQWYPKIMRKDYTVALGVTASGLDDPDQQFYENYVCGAERNDNGYCNSEVDKLVDRQSMEPDMQKRRELVWEIERKLAEDVARPIIFYPRSASCWQPYIKGLTIMVNSIYNGWRMEDVWLDK